MEEIHLPAVLAAVGQPDETYAARARARLDSLAKPPGSLGMLEDIAARLCAISGALQPDISRRRILVFAADNGVVEEGVASGPQWITAAQTVNIARGLTGVGAIARGFAADIRVYDLGVNAQIDHPLVHDRKIRYGTGNIAHGPAMTRGEAVRALMTGHAAALEAAQGSVKLMGIGEMGIGNTTTSAAVLCALLGLPAASVVGRGAGLDDAGYEKKVAAVERALQVNRPDPGDALDVLHKVGGLDIAAMAGAFIGCAACGLPVVVDGLISAVAALCAVRLCPGVREYLFASHQSHERGYAAAIGALALTPCLNLGMRLGEGSGCPLMFGVMDAALAVLRDMGTFAELSIDDGYLEGVRKLGKDAF